MLAHSVIGVQKISAEGQDERCVYNRGGRMHRMERCITSIFQIIQLVEQSGHIKGNLSKWMNPAETSSILAYIFNI